MTKAAIYARVSTEEQLTGYSIAAQVDACRKLCEDRGWIVAAEFVEGGESGKTFSQRPQWQAFMQGARNGAYDVLVCHKIDRFSRATILDSLQTLKDLKALGITFTSASEPIDLTTPYGEVMLLLMLWFARQYLTNLSGEVTKGRRKRAESGRSNANRPPFGYKRVNGEDVPDEATSQYVQAAFERYSTGLHGDGDMARWLNAQGARTLDGNPFTSGAIRELLINPFYAGWVRYRGIREALTNKRTRRRETRIIRGMHESIITQALFDRAQAIRKTRDRREGRPTTNNRVYLLKDLAHCAHCGGRMKCSYSRSGQLRYTCYAHERAHDPKPCKAAGRSVREDNLMPQINEFIASLRLPDAVINRAAELAASESQHDAAQARRREIIAEMKRLDYLFQKGRKTQKEYEREAERLEAELHLLEPQITDVDESGDVLSELADAWLAAEDDQAARREILLSLLQNVRVDALKSEIVQWTPHPEFAPIFDAADVGGYKFGSDRTRTCDLCDVNATL